MISKDSLIKLLKSKKIIASDLNPLGIAYIYISLPYMTRENGFNEDDVYFIRQFLKDWEINEIETIYQELYTMGIEIGELENKIREYLGGK